MTEHDGGTGSNSGNGGDASDRLAAHERLSTGALARWYRACATHPWRVVLSWVGIVVVLIALVATVGGGLKDEFEIPGSDTQKATDLIESEFASEQGGVLNIVFAAPAGERLDTPERKAGDRGRDREAQDLGVQADRGQGRDRERRRSVRPEHGSPTTAASPTRRPSSIGSSTTRIARPSSPSRTPSARRSSRRA